MRERGGVRELERGKEKEREREREREIDACMTNSRKRVQDCDDSGDEF